jgi:hypothetical protein
MSVGHSPGRIPHSHGLITSIASHRPYRHPELPIWTPLPEQRRKFPARSRPVGGVMATPREQRKGRLAVTARHQLPGMASLAAPRGVCQPDGLDHRALPRRVTWPPPGFLLRLVTWRAILRHITPGEGLACAQSCG